jgi:hypothetical protein
MTAGENAASGDRPGGALGRLLEAIDTEPARRGPPPVDKWNPACCGEIDLRIAADGSWHYMGTPIARPALVRLFSTILRKDPERYVLVTPVERVGITVDDLPFTAVEMAVEGTADDSQIALRTSVDDVVAVSRENPLRFDSDERGGVRPAVRVRGGLWARLTRSLALDLIELGEERATQDGVVFGVSAAGQFFPIGRADTGDWL